MSKIVGHYDVTREGDVISKRTGRFLKLGHGNGQGRYLRACLSVKGVKEYKLVHRMVAEKYITNPNNYPEVNHKNKIDTDNRVENLEWCNRSQNNTHASGKDVQITDGNMSMWFPTIASAANFIKVNSGNMYRLINKIKYTHIKGWKIV